VGLPFFVTYGASVWVAALVVTVAAVPISWWLRRPGRAAGGRKRRPLSIRELAVACAAGLGFFFAAWAAIGGGLEHWLVKKRGVSLGVQESDGAIEVHFALQALSVSPLHRKRALGYLQRALESGPPRGRAGTDAAIDLALLRGHCELAARIALRRGQWRRGVELAERCPPGRLARVTRVRAYERLGRYDEASAALTSGNQPIVAMPGEEVVDGLSWYHVMEHDGAPGEGASAVPWQIAVRIHLLAGRLEVAADLLDEVSSQVRATPDLGDADSLKCIAYAARARLGDGEAASALSEAARSSRDCDAALAGITPPEEWSATRLTAMLRWYHRMPSVPPQTYWCRAPWSVSSPELPFRLLHELAGLGNDESGDLQIRVRAWASETLAFHLALTDRRERARALVDRALADRERLHGAVESDDRRHDFAQALLLRATIATLEGDAQAASELLERARVVAAGQPLCGVDFESAIPGDAGARAWNLARRSGVSDVHPRETREHQRDLERWVRFDTPAASERHWERFEEVEAELLRMAVASELARALGDDEWTSELDEAIDRWLDARLEGDAGLLYASFDELIERIERW
jgi:tetratricopeptide (TPR) repeat protein